MQVMSPTVQVLLATYNGQRFLRQQIDSILSQTHQDLTILARDDGSSDASAAILQDYATRMPARFTLLPTGSPSGSAKANFIRLIDASTAPFLAFADQDDVWLTTKIADSLALLQSLEIRYSADVPLLVFTDLQVVDAALEPLQPSFWAHQNIDPSCIDRFNRLLTQNVVTGCTMLFNRPLADLASPMPPEAFMHDWWIALLAASFGHAAFLSTPSVLYRQHDANVIGAMDHVPPRGIPKWRFHEKRRAQWEMCAHQAAALLAHFGDRLPPVRRLLLEAYVRCENSPSRLVRVSTLVRHGFFLKGIRPNLAILWYLWDMQAAKKNG